MLVQPQRYPGSYKLNIALEQAKMGMSDGLRVRVVYGCRLSNEVVVKISVLN